MYPEQMEPSRFSDFVRLERNRYPDATWEQCETWLEADWVDYAPQVPWMLARFYVLDAWRKSAATPPRHRPGYGRFAKIA